MSAEQFYSFEQMRVFAKVGLVYASAKGAATEPHDVARFNAEQALALLAGSESEPVDLDTVTEAAVNAARQTYVDLKARAEERLSIPESLRTTFGVSVPKEERAKTLSEEWIAAFDEVIEEEFGG